MKKILLNVVLLLKSIFNTFLSRKNLEALSQKRYDAESVEIKKTLTIDDDAVETAFIDKQEQIKIMEQEKFNSLIDSSLATEKLNVKEEKCVLISFVIPVYGAEEYLEKCINSILFENDNRPIEVIAINDGSPDNSAEILDSLAKTYSSLRVIHQENIGGAGTINRGLKLAQGKYVSIIDNDDWLMPNSVNEMLRIIENEQYDIISTQVLKRWNTKQEIAYDTSYINKEEVLKASKKPSMMNDGFYLGKLFNRSFLDSRGIWMDPTLLYADKPFVSVALAEANSILLLPRVFCCWRQRETTKNLSITDNQYSLENLRDRVRSIRIMKFELVTRGHGYWLNTIDYFNCHRVFWCMKNVKVTSPVSFKKEYEYLREFAKITKPYFNEVDLKKITNLTPTQNFIVNSIRNNTHEVFPVLYLQRKYKYLTETKISSFKKAVDIRKKELPLVVKSLPNLTTAKIFNQFSKNKLKHISFNEDHDPQLIVFESNFGKVYGQNPRYIYEELLRQNRSFRAVWVYQDKDKNLDIPGRVVQVRRGSDEYFNYLGRAGYWVNNIRFSVTYKPERTVYLQTWHGTPLKRLGLDISVSGPEVEARENFLKESANWDFLLAQNTYSSEIFKRAFAVNGEIITKGYPADDIFLQDNQEQTARTKDKLNISDKKVILYAPTWRDDARQGSSWNFSFSLALDLKEMKERLSDDYVLLLRLHHLISDKIDLSGLSGFVIDVSKYSDTSELLLISDLLITDYSSIFFDYATLKRPILFYMYDLEEYASELRGFYLDIERDLPGNIIRSFEELVAAIENIDLDVCNNYNFIKFYDKYCSEQKQNSAELIVNKVFEKLPYIS
ncbi:MAG: bifunctional glycosyltransferase/CDP-glycerol:glycerophosphate glycerophosphotransferase [Moraxellaceae bacterium]